MHTEHPITVEVVNDSLSQLDTTGHILDGIAYFNELASGILYPHVSESDASLGIEEYEVVELKHVARVAPQTSDMFLVGTYRLVGMRTTKHGIETIEHVVGVATYNPNRYGGAALISSYYAEAPFHMSITAAHELGHLFGLVYPNKRRDHAHCPDNDCIMYQRVPAEVARTTEPSENAGFCNSCQQQIGQRTLELVRAREVDRSFLWAALNPAKDRVYHTSSRADLRDYAQ